MAYPSSAEPLHYGTSAPTATLGEDRLALGVALQSRSRPIATVVAASFPAHLRDEVFESARSATELVGRWLATGEKGVDDERRTNDRWVQTAMLVESDLATTVRGYLSWRDLCAERAGRGG